MRADLGHYLRVPQANLTWLELRAFQIGQQLLRYLLLQTLRVASCIREQTGASSPLLSVHLQPPDSAEAMHWYLATPQIRRRKIEFRLESEERRGVTLRIYGRRWKPDTHRFKTRLGDVIEAAG
jgi:hypothetical protein